MAYDGMTRAKPSGPSRAAVAAMLVGRDHELGLIASFLDYAAAEGAALVFSGEPGVGKTALLDAAVEAAAAAGTQVLRAAGSEFENEAKFSGLSRLLRPVLGELRQLSDAYRHALSVALGLGHGALSDRLVVSNAVLALLRQARVARPLLGWHAAGPRQSNAVISSGSGAKAPSRKRLRASTERVLSVRCSRWLAR